MCVVCYVGDEATAAGFRVAGARVRVCDPPDAAVALAAALAEGDLVLVAASWAAALPPAQLSRWLAAPAPLLLVVPDVSGRAQAPNVAARLREQLGLAE